MLQNKEKNKISFCQDFDLDYNKNRPLLCITFPLTEKNNMELLKDVIHGILEESFELAVLGIGTQKYQNFFTELIRKYPKKIAIVDESDENRSKVYAASDMFLATSDTEECQQEMKKAMSYGVVPICPENEWVQDYNGAKEEGNGFIYKKESPWSFFASLIRALENFKFPYDWKSIQSSAMDDSETDEKEMEE